MARAATERPKQQLEFDTIALLPQGGGALGAYEAGAYQALAEANVLPNWVAGISIGATQKVRHALFGRPSKPCRTIPARDKIKRLETEADQTVLRAGAKAP